MVADHTIEVAFVDLVGNYQMHAWERKMLNVDVVSPIMVDVHIVVFFLHETWVLLVLFLFY